jgi:hypothetical protein
MKLFFLCSFMLFSPYIFATDFEVIGASAKACAGTFLHRPDVWTSFNHAANMPTFGKFGIGFQAERKFSLSNFQSVAFASIVPVKKQHFIGLGIYCFGDNAYSFSRLNVAYAKQIGLFAIGISTEALQWHVIETTTTYRGIVNLGGKAILLKDKLWVGTQVLNLLQTQISKTNNEVIPSLMCLGLNYKHNVKINLLTEYQLHTDHKSVPKLAVEYTPIPLVVLRMGISSFDLIYHAGIGIKAKKWTIDYAFISHPQLNHSQSIGVAFSPY